MRNGKGMIGKPIVAYDSGEEFKTIVDLIFDQEKNQLLGFLVDEGGWFSNALVLPLSKIQAIGADAVIVSSRNAIDSAAEFPAIQSILERDNILKGTRIMTVDGRDLGTMVDLYFDDTTGVIEGYEVSGGIFADAYSGRSFVPAPDTLKIGEDIAFVPSETADLMQEQVGGIRGAMQTASGKVQEMAQFTGEKAQEAAHFTGEKFHEATQMASTTFTNAVVNPEEQEAFVLGKVAQETIETNDGIPLIREGQVVTQAHILAARNCNMIDNLYHATGGSVKDRLGERLSGSVAGIGANIGIEQAQGRRVNKMIFTPEGSVVAVEGQIVTSRVIERAKTHHQEQALLEAVGLTTGDALRVTGSNVGQQVKDGAKGLWEQVKETASNLQDHGNQAIEDKRIKGALGRPVTRVILDRNDEVILNVGELITHQAIAISRDADVLEVLLDSVYTDTPTLSLEDLRAPDAGKAALT
ncbi:PRC-barrel domain-containing protein [Pseudanabaena sp. FACHB-1998]|uniref:PRC-barrel domain-containing protein n=1 Tax=Pseudanabaena sp. FACHB-1998 TaxID=2692858 RepID=UPI001680BE68|nr:PRC-barrel domain-containing protein [Pseudanabaena sp. FACHB-1998]MBD2178622.1 PRC-barrel domain-containing protein [Pseudanabaena sp. FACHB-1998]